MKRNEKTPTDPELTRRIQELIQFKNGGHNETEVADIIENALKRPASSTRRMAVQ